jgi:hypothetical protein
VNSLQSWLRFGGIYSGVIDNKKRISDCKKKNEAVAVDFATTYSLTFQIG